MPGKKYPLEPLVRVRRDHVEKATHNVATAISERQSRERARRGAEEERARVALEADRVRSEEREALEHGRLTAEDLQRQGAWQARMSLEDQERAHKVLRARQREEEGVRAESEARSLAAKAEAEAKVMTKHHDAWAAKEERAAEAAAEEGAAEAWRPRR